MNLKIKQDDKYYKSNSITHGRMVKKFFYELTGNVFKQSNRYWKASSKIHAGYGGEEIPLLFSERNIYSLFAVAIDKITPIHLSEWPLNRSDYKLDNSRRVDFWCLNKNSNSRKALNYFIELKKGSYCLNKNSNHTLRKNISKDIESLQSQATTLKKISPQWGGFDDVFLGISVIHGYYRTSEEYYNQNDIRESFHELIDGRLNAQMIMSTWILPETMNVQWERDKCRFISIVGIVITKAK